MKKEIKKVKPLNKKSGSKGTGKIPPFPVNPPSEDIYRNSIEEEDVDPEDTTKTKALNEDDQTVRGKRKRKETNNEKDFKDDVSGDDLDVPGSESDDGERMNGEEDEENDYYSLGGDDHNDLEEDRGD
jgi:hypothetical protein